ncbi:MAG: helix-turn-helix domain-containing protein [Candidatus Omnitrophota bacterium]
MAEKLITVREVANILDISEQEVIDIAEQGVIPAYKIAGTHLRFKKEQINHIRHLDHIKFKTRSGALKYSWGERVRDFFYFNDFYLVSGALIAFMAWIILR